MTAEPPARPSRRPGTSALIVGLVLLLTGAISIAALALQLVNYDPPCEPPAAWSFLGACGALRLLVLLMLPFLLGGIGLVAVGLVLRRRCRAGGRN
jgi:hypothetical protein